MDPIILGWDSKQWSKAFDYYNLCEKRGEPDCFFEALAESPYEGRPYLKKLAEVAKYWRDRRRDQPADTIVLADTYRARKETHNA